ncbi:MAG: MBL fold metallo-hydrolase [Kiritimatiellae bacterium]|nr:MBL fold metallo-hydrolase [Kiritimatiellia bacterium]
MNRRDFLKASACVAAGGALGRAWAADAQACVPPVKVTPYFKDGWTMYMFANRGNAQMLSTLFRSPSGKVAMVDGGWPKDAEDLLLPTLKALGGTVDTWFLTHAHGDHYGALADIVKRPDCGGLKIGRVVHNFLPLDFIAATEKASIPYVTPFLEDLGKSGLRVEKPAAGQTFDLGEGLAFECLNDYDLSMRNNSINNSSICYRVTNGGKSILVTGDIGVEMGDKLLNIQPPEKIKSDVVFLSHHGQCGANKNFYAAVKPEICVWPTPQWLWDNNIGGGVGSGPWRTNFTKCWMQELGVKRQILLTKDAALGPI